MERKTYRVQEVADLTNVTVRTLHHYDEIGLLKPSGRSPSGYRLYSDEDLFRLQQILLQRELGLPLRTIKKRLDDPTFDYRAALLEQRRVLLERAEELDHTLRSIDVALAKLDGEAEVDMRELFDGFDPARYAHEVESRWGDTDAFHEASNRTRDYSAVDWKTLKAEGERLMRKMASELRRGSPPDTAVPMGIAEEHRAYIGRWFYSCSRSMHAGLADLYVADARFKATFDDVEEGLAHYFASAVRANASRGRL